MTRKEMGNLLWEAKMMGKWAPCEGESIEEAYARTFPSSARQAFETNTKRACFKL